MGRICNDQGDAFNQHISDIIKSFGVFRVFPNVKRINKKKIADEKSDVLGDIDVLIIDEKKHRIVVAEVKNFDFSKNPYEIQAEYQKMFVDGKKVGDAVHYELGAGEEKLIPFKLAKENKQPVAFTTKYKMVSM